MKSMFALCLALAMLDAGAEALPANVHIVYQARLAGLPIGHAEQRWQTTEGRYTLSTELVPIFGPRIRYLSHGTADAKGLVPTDYAEFRNSEAAPRRVVRFDWPHHEASFGVPDALETGTLQAGAQELNTLPFQLATLAGKHDVKLQLATGRKLKNQTFSTVDSPQLNLQGKTVDTVAWRAAEGDDRTEVWLAPSLGNLPVKIIRSDDKGELQLVAQSIDIEPEKP